MKRKGKHLNFELNIIPFIDLLSALICFLLMTAVWIQLKSVDSKQAIGSETLTKQTTEPASLLVDINTRGDLVFALKNVRSAQFNNVVISKQGNGINWERVASYLTSLKEAIPAIDTAVIQPKQNSKYDDLVQLMAEMKKTQILNVGISPL